MQVRTKAQFLKTKEITFPADPEYGETEDTVFTIKRATNAEDVQRANLFSKVRFVYDADGYSTERDYPEGDMQMETIRLCLVDWNLCDEKGNKLPVTVPNMNTWLKATERKKLYSEILDFNPTWKYGRDEEKND